MTRRELEEEAGYLLRRWFAERDGSYSVIYQITRKRRPQEERVALAAIMMRELVLTDDRQARAFLKMLIGEVPD